MPTRKKRVSQAQQRRQRLGANRVTKREAVANPAERGRAGLTRLHKIGAQGNHAPAVVLPGGTFTTVGAAPRKKKARRKKR
jgi:hypothetical protein